MPDITFILPHWLYWGGIFAVPAGMMLWTRRAGRRDFSPGRSLFAAYFLWAAGGFAGLHRLYLRSWGAAAFVLLLVGVLYCNHQARETRNAHSIAKNETFNANYDLQAAKDEGETEEKIAELQNDVDKKSAAETALSAQMENWRRGAQTLAAAILALLVLDGLLMRRMTRRSDAAERRRQSEEPPPTLAEHPQSAAEYSGAFGRTVSKINMFVGEFASYWTVVAVFVLYYEVIARYIFNSPTIWAHESMFLLFGAQYMLAGGFCLRENSHVRVDVIYARFSPRTRAAADIATSSVFFLFTGALAVTGWIFFYDSFDIRQVSHTEWQIPYWPVKFALPLGGALILLQGFAHLLRDVETFRRAGK